MHRYSCSFLPSLSGHPSTLTPSIMVSLLDIVLFDEGDRMGQDNVVAVTVCDTIDRLSWPCWPQHTDVLYRQNSTLNALVCDSLTLAQ